MDQLAKALFQKLLEKYTGLPEKRRRQIALGYTVVALYVAVVAGWVAASRGSSFAYAYLVFGLLAGGVLVFSNLEDAVRKGREEQVKHLLIHWQEKTAGHSDATRETVHAVMNDFLAQELARIRAAHEAERMRRS